MKTLRFIFFTIGLFFALQTNAQHFKSFKTIPANPTENDSIKLVLEITSGTYSEIIQESLTQVSNDVYITICMYLYNATAMSLHKDTFSLNKFSSGSYTVNISIQKSSDPNSCIPIDSTITTDSFYVASAVSLPEHQLLQKLKIYPNPTKDYLNITTLDKLEINGIEIRNIQGKLVKTKNPAGASQDKRSINISKLPPGTYVLMLKTNKGNASKQFVVE